MDAETTWKCADDKHEHPTAVEARDCSLNRLGPDEWRRRWARERKLTRLSAAARLERGKPKP